VHLQRKQLVLEKEMLQQRNQKEEQQQKKVLEEKQQKEKQQKENQQKNVLKVERENARTCSFFFKYQPSPKIVALDVCSKKYA
jgi:hypothetical protein